MTPEELYKARVDAYQTQRSQVYGDRLPREPCSNISSACAWAAGLFPSNTGVSPFAALSSLIRPSINSRSCPRDGGTSASGFGEEVDSVGRVGGLTSGGAIWVGGGGCVGSSAETAGSSVALGCSAVSKRGGVEVIALLDSASDFGLFMFPTTVAYLGRSWQQTVTALRQRRLQDLFLFE